MLSRTKHIVLFLLLSTTLTAAYGQSSNHSIYEHLIAPKSQMEHIDTLCSGSMKGRAMGTEGNALARDYIIDKFMEYGVRKRGILYEQDFICKGKKGVNIIGEIESAEAGGDYIIICAHYDHLGEIDSRIYPGADDNASGVAAMLELAKVFGKMKNAGMGVKSNLIFIAFDGKEAGLAGSRHFAGRLKIHPKRIKCVLNIDQIGTASSPPHGNREYILVMGIDAVQKWMKERLELCNSLSDLNLDIDYTYYGSKKFYDIFYRMSDHYPFTSLAIPSLLYTCGIDSNTYKVTDTPDKIDYNVLTKRIRLIYRFIFSIAN